MNFMYRIKEEYYPEFTDNDKDAVLPISEDALIYLAREWDVPVKELMEKVELMEGE